MPLRAKLRHDGVASCSLVPLTAGGTRPPIVLTDPSIVIGSGNAAQIRLKSSSVSKAHALILVEDGKAYVRDLGSRTQLYVNDAPVREAFLGEGDVVRVGRFGFGVHENAAALARPHAPATPTVRLRISGSGLERLLGGRVILIGRRHGCDVIVPEHTLSGAHAVLFHLRGQWWVRDLGSRSGTLVNGTEVRQQRALSDGDLLKLGSAEVQFLGAPVAGAVELPESMGTPQDTVEIAGPVDDVAEEFQPAETPASEPEEPPVHAGSGSARAAVFADAPIGSARVDEPLSPPAELPAVAGESPAASGGNGWEDRDGGGEVSDSDADDGEDEDDDVGEPEGDGSSGALEARPASEKEWDEEVTVWSFAELAKRGRGQSSRDDVQVSMAGPASERRRWVWVTVGAAIACVAVLVTLMAHKLW